jgi:hypothetical protein
MNTLFVLTNNWPQILAFLVAVALAIVGFCKAVAILLATLAVLTRLVSEKAAAKVQWLSEFFAKLGHNAQDAFVHAKILKDPDDASPPPPKKPGVGTQISGAALGLLVLCGALWIASTIVGCLSQKEAKIVSDTGAEVACIFAHDGEPPLQIMIDCNVQSEKIVSDILSEKHKAEKRKLEVAHCTGGE